VGQSKFFIKRGRESAGSTAKAITDRYLHFKKEAPFLSQAKLLKLVVRERIDLYEQMELHCPYTLDIADASQGDLRTLIYCIVMFELPEKDKTNLLPYQTQMIIKLINEVVDKYLP
jgi:hypothetical protein